MGQHIEGLAEPGCDTDVLGNIWMQMARFGCSGDHVLSPMTTPYDSQPARWSGEDLLDWLISKDSVCQLTFPGCTFSELHLGM